MQYPCAADESCLVANYPSGLAKFIREQTNGNRVIITGIVLQQRQHRHTYATDISKKQRLDLLGYLKSL
ncbi:MAG: hypothetical protein P8Y45_05800 [Exilibacterium sp.]